MVQTRTLRPPAVAHLQWVLEKGPTGPELPLVLSRSPTHPDSCTPGAGRDARQANVTPGLLTRAAEPLQRPVSSSPSQKSESTV